MTRRLPWARQIWAMAAILLAFAGPAYAQSSQVEWRGFRGLDRHGVAAVGPAAAAWTAAPQVRWRTPIPGNGHSSPVVSQGRVYLTTAYESMRTVMFHRILLALSLTFLLLVVGPGFYLMGSHARCATAGPSGAACLLSLVMYGLGIAALAVLLLFGRNVLDFARCPIRNWLGMSLAISLAIFTCEYRACITSRASLLRGMAYLGFAVFVTAGMPAREHAFRIGLLGPSAVVVGAMGAVPGLLGVSRILGRAIHRRAPADARLRLTDRMALRPVDLGELALASLAVVLGSAVGIRLIVAVGEGDLPTGVTWGPVMLAWVLLMLAAGLLLGSWLIARPPGSDAGSASPTRRRMALTLMAADALVVAGGAAIGLVFREAVSRSSYLTYHFPMPRWQSEYGTAGVAAVVLVAFLAALAALAVGPRIGRSAKAATVTLRGAAVGLSLVCLVSAWVPPGERTIARAILCLDGATGRKLWTCEGLVGPEGALHVCNSPATPTPVLTGNRLCAYFGGAGVMCSDLNGKLLWENPSVRFQGIYGAGASPVANDQVVVISLGMTEGPYTVALDLRTGHEVWRANWEARPSYNISGNSRTPFIVRVGDEEQLVLWKFERLAGYGLNDGAERWSYMLPQSRSDLVGSPIVADGRIYCASPERVVALDIDRLGQPEPPIVWQKRLRGPNCTSPVAANGKLLMVADYGQVTCLDAHSGEELWRQRLSGRYFASPLALGKQVLFSNLRGLSTVVAAEGEFRKITEFDFAEGIYASAAPDERGGVFLRTETTLLRLERPHEATARALDGTSR